MSFRPTPDQSPGSAGIQEFERLLDTGFRRYDGKDLNDLFNKLWFQDTSAVFLTASLRSRSGIIQEPIDSTQINSQAL